jgi:hypothetical protein
MRSHDFGLFKASHATIGHFRQTQVASVLEIVIAS